jgi:hypothetical protein
MKFNELIQMLLGSRHVVCIIVFQNEPNYKLLKI